MPDRPGAPSSQSAYQGAGARVGVLFSDHGRMVYGLCRMLLNDPTEAEDAAQETFMAAFRSLLHGGGPRDPAAWLSAIARNECRTRLRARRREPVAVVGEPRASLAEGPHVLVERRQRIEELARALGELPERQREAVLLRDVYGLRTREVGTALGISRPAVESLVFRARRRLRVRLRPAAGVLVLPLALREGLAQALPGFATGAAGAAGATGAAATGTVLLTKLATGTVAVGAATSVALVEAERAGPPPRSARPPVTARAAPGPLQPAPAGAVVRASAAPAVTPPGTRRDEPDRREQSGSGKSGPGRDDEERDDGERRARDPNDSDRSGPDERGGNPEAIEIDIEDKDGGEDDGRDDTAESEDDSGEGSSSGPGGGGSDPEEDDSGSSGSSGPGGGGSGDDED